MRCSWSVLCVLGCAGLWGRWSGARAQYFEDPQINFKPFKFDMDLRGQYNISHCAEELLKCWEVMRPDVMCDNQFFKSHFNFETICALDKRLCNERYGYFSTWFRYTLFTGYCPKGWYNWYNRGKWT